MSQGNVAFEMGKGTPFAKPDAAKITEVVNIDDATYGRLCMFGLVTSTPPSTAGKYGPGCMLVSTSGTSSITHAYTNVGTAASPSWVGIESTAT